MPQATVSWHAPANGGHAISGYVVTPYLGSAAQPSQTFHSTATSEVVTGLTNSKSYSFRVAARNAGRDRSAVGAGRPGEADVGAGAHGRDRERLDVEQGPERDRRRYGDRCIMYTPDGSGTISKAGSETSACGRRSCGRARRRWVAVSTRARPRCTFSPTAPASCRTTVTCSTRSSTTSVREPQPVTASRASFSCRRGTGQPISERSRRPAMIRSHGATAEGAANRPDGSTPRATVPGVADAHRRLERGRAPVVRALDQHECEQPDHQREPGDQQCEVAATEDLVGAHLAGSSRCVVARRPFAC